MNPGLLLWRLLERRSPETQHRVWRVVRFAKRQPLMLYEGLTHADTLGRLVQWGELEPTALLPGLYFRETPSVRQLGSLRGFPLPKGPLLADATLEALRCDPIWGRRGERRGYHRTPEWVRTHIDLRDGNPLEHPGSSLKSNLAKFRQYSFALESTQDPRDLEVFYRDFYIPYTTGKFGPGAAVRGLEEFWQPLREGRLVWFSLEGRRLGAALMRRQRDRVLFESLGLLQDLSSRVRGVLFTAFYVEVIQWAVAQGVRWIELGGSRPLPGGSLLQYKAKYGAKLDPAPMRVKELHWRAIGDDPGVAAMLQRSPLLALDASGLHVVTADGVRRGADLLALDWTSGERAQD